jgi:hypothetical protein
LGYGLINFTRNPVAPFICDHKQRTYKTSFRMETDIVIVFLVFVSCGVLGQRPGGNLPPLSNFPGSQNGGTLPPLGGSTRNGIPIPPVGAIPPPNTAFTSNPNSPPTPPPWMPSPSAQNAGNIGAVPTAQSSPSSITFVSVSGTFPSVSIPDNGYDDHYVTIKSMFDTYYPNVPPLRRAANRATLQIFRGGTGVAATAVVSDDPTTLYIQYALPQQNAFAYLPFASDNMRRLKYPERPIYLPYPPKIDGTERNRKCLFHLLFLGVIYLCMKQPYRQFRFVYIAYI